MCLSVFQRNKSLKFFLLFIIVLLFKCAPGKSVKRPDWTRGSVPPYYVGQSSLQEDKKKAIDEAFYNALQEFYGRELGIIVKNETFIRKSEKGDSLTIEYESSIKSKTNAVVLKNVKKLKEYVEKEKGKYRAFVEIYIPEEEVIKAKKEAEEYKKSIENFVEKDFEIAEKLSQEGRDERAIFHYKTIKMLLEEVPGVSPGIRDIVEARIDALSGSNNPIIRLMNLPYTEKYFHKVELVKSGEKGEISHSDNTYYVDIGDRVRLNIKVGRPVYVYILSLWEDVGEVRLLYPNWIEKEEKLIKGEMIFPEESEFEAEPPPGLNYLFVIATPFTLNLQKYITFKEGENFILSKENLSDLLKLLEKQKTYDVKKINILIKESK